MFIDLVIKTCMFERKTMRNVIEHWLLYRVNVGYGSGHFYGCWDILRLEHGLVMPS